MSKLGTWIAGLGNIYVPYVRVFEENGIDDLATLRELEIDDLVGDLGIKKIHAKIIFIKLKHHFGNTLKPSTTKITEQSKMKAVITINEEKIDAEKIALYKKSLPNVGSNCTFISELLKCAEVNSVIAKALDLVHSQIEYINKLRREPPQIKNRGFLSHVQGNSADLCRSISHELKEKNVEV